MKNNNKDLSRRKFIGQASCAGIGYATLLNTMLNFKAISASAALNSDSCTGFNNSGYKALVCIMLSGGADSYNMLIPTDNHPNEAAGVSYSKYAESRGSIKIPDTDIIDNNGNLEEEGLLSLNNDYFIHPKLNGIKTLFDNGKLSFVTNVGTLIDPMNYGQYQANANRPLGLFSHADQIQQWQTAIYDSRTQYGWGGRIADMVNSCNNVNTSPISMNFTLSGSNVFQASQVKSEYAMTSEGPIRIEGYDEQSADFITQLRTKSVKDILEHDYQDIFKNTYTSAIKDGKEAEEIIRIALENNLSTVNDNDFSDNSVSQALMMIAKTIEIQSTLNFDRQIFFVNFGGWDHHDNLKTNQDGMLKILGDAMLEFQNAIDSINKSNEVVTFTMSEFGRTLTSNGDGSDHAWGGNVMFMGGGHQGGQIIGEYPSLSLLDTLDTSGINVSNRGIFIPTTSIDQYLGDLAMWFGVPHTDLSDIFPGIGNVWTHNTANPTPLGLFI